VYQALGDQGRAADHLDAAVRGGEQVDLQTRLGILVIGGVLAGKDDAAIDECRRSQRAVRDDPSALAAATHALRLPAYRGLAPIVAAVAGAGGSVRSSNGALVYAGGRAAGLPPELAGLGRVSAAGYAATPDSRYFAVSLQSSDSLLVFDAARGQAQPLLRRAAGDAPTDALRAVAALDVVEAAFPFLARSVERALTAGGDRATLEGALSAALKRLATAPGSYALVMTNGGEVKSGVSLPMGLAAGDPVGFRAADAASLQRQLAEYGGALYVDFAGPLTVGGAKRGVLRVGVRIPPQGRELMAGSE
jgi:hypothetical protein